MQGLKTGGDNIRGQVFDSYVKSPRIMTAPKEVTEQCHNTHSHVFTGGFILSDDLLILLPPPKQATPDICFMNKQ